MLIHDACRAGEVPARRWPAWFYAALLLIGLLGAHLRFRDLMWDSFWLDELHTVGIAEKPVPELVDHFRTTAFDPHPPLYFILCRGLMGLAEDTESVLRGFSAASGTAAVPALGLIAAALGGPTAGLGAAALLAVNNFHVYYSREARSNAFVSLLAIPSFGSLLLCCSSRPRLWLLVPYVLSSAVLIYSHYFGSVLLAIEGLTLVVLCRDLAPRAFGRALLALGIVGLLYAPWLPTHLACMRGSGFWAQTPGVAQLVDLIRVWWTLDPFVLLGQGILLLLGARCLLPSERGALLTGVLLWMLGVIALTYYKSRLSESVWVDRNLLPVLPGWILLMGLGVGSLRSDGSRVLLVGGVMAGFVLAGRTPEGNDLGSRGHSGARPAIRWIAELNALRGDPVSAEREPVFLGFYFRKFGAQGWTGLALPGDVAQLPSVVWLIEYHGGVNGEQQAVLEQHYQPVLQRQISATRVRLFARTDHPIAGEPELELALRLGPACRRLPGAPDPGKMLSARRRNTALVIVSSDEFLGSMPTEFKQGLADLVGSESAAQFEYRSSLAAIVQPDGSTLSQASRTQSVELSANLRWKKRSLPVTVVANSFHDARPASVQIGLDVLPVAPRGLTIYRIHMPSLEVRLVWAQDTCFGHPPAMFERVRSKPLRGRVPEPGS